jgi:hypothetical protein
MLHASLPLLAVLTAAQSPLDPPALWHGAQFDGQPEIHESELRWRPVTLAGQEWLATESAATVALELFDGETLVVELERRGTPRPGSALWFSDLGAPDGGDRLWLAYVDGTATAALSLGEREFRLRGSEAGLLLAEIDGSRFAPCAVGPEHEVAATSRPGSRPAVADGVPGADAPAVAQAAQLQVVDVLTAYTPAARQSSGGTAGIQSLIDLAIARTNESFENCDAGLVVRDVHTVEVNYSESSSISTDLSRFRGKTDGFMDEVHDLRDLYGADACALISNSSGACGVAYLMTNVSPGFQGSAFSVTVRSCAVGNLTYAHELGHNFGCAHDRDNAGGASKPYAYGYRTPNNQYRTVMAYSPGSRKPIFSSPLHQWNGLVMGTAAGEDNARALTENAPTIAGWRESTVDSPDCNENGLPDSYEIAVGLVTDLDGDGVPDQCGPLFADVASLSIQAGGTQSLTLDAGPERGGELYVLLGSLAGTAPATDLLGVTVPLAADAYFDLTLFQGGAGLLTGGFGTLGPDGRAEAAFTIPPSAFFGLIATPAHHAYVTLDATLQPTFVSNAVPVYFTWF